MKKVYEIALHAIAFRSILSPPTRTHIMNQLLQIANIASHLIKNANTMDKVNALIGKWSHKDLGPANEWLTSAAHWEARNQVFGWGK